MKINTITYYIKDAFVSLKRNKTISIASIITVLITFFVLGIFMLVATNINQGIDSVQNKVEIKVFLKDDIKLIDQREIEIKLREIDGVKDVTYSSKEDEYRNFQETTNEGEGLLKVGKDTAILQITPTAKEFEFVETNINKLAAMQNQ